MEFNKFANLFPLMRDKEYDLLIDDIQKNGQLEPITTYKEEIIDGRNRFNACLDIGIEPVFEEFKKEEKDIFQFVLSKNLNRRHLNETQRAVIASKLANMGQGERTDLEHSALMRKVNQSEAAEMFNVSKRLIQQVKAVEKESSELFAQMESGELTANKATKQIKEDKRKSELEAQKAKIESGEIALPKGVFEVIVVDPPWPYGTKYDAKGRRAANPYPEMSLEEISNIELPSSEDSVLWLWTTHKFMRYAFDIIDIWGFRDVSIVTWEKNRIGLGHWLRSNTEFCIMCVKGSPTINLTNQSTILHGTAREHSRKPEEFYQMVDVLCLGRKLDYFSREEREGWSQIGDEIHRF